MRINCYKTYFGLGSGEKLTDDPFLNCEGMQQDAVDSMPIFNIGIGITNEKTNNKWKELNARLRADAGDTYIIWPPPEQFDALLYHKFCLAKLGIELNLAKTKWNIDANFCDDEFQRIRDDIKEGDRCKSKWECET